MSLGNIKQRAKNILHLGESPHELAKAFAVGVFVAFTPFIGIHTLLVLMLAWAFRLNKLVALTGTFVNNPWTIAFVYIGPTWACVRAMRYLGIPVRHLNYDMLRTEFLETMQQYSIWQPVFWTTFLHEFKPYIRAFLIGTTVAGVMASLLAYVVVLVGVKYYREKIKAEARKVRHG